MLRLGKCKQSEYTYQEMMYVWKEDNIEGLPVLSDTPELAPGRFIRMISIPAVRNIRYFRLPGDTKERRKFLTVYLFWKKT